MPGEKIGGGHYHPGLKGGEGNFEHLQNLLPIQDGPVQNPVENIL
jgi:hypothetical protein